MADYEHIVVGEVGAVTRITLDRPAQRNALSLALMRELTTALRTAAGRVVVLDGAGPCFSAGHDLTELIDRPVAWYQDVFDACVELMEAVQSVPQPVIAKVHGVATAAGCQLVATCDLALADEGARFATPGVNIGLFCSTPMVALSRAVGAKRSLEMLLTGTMIDAATAADWGLVNRVVAADRLDDEVMALAEHIASASPLTVRIGKRAFYAQVGVDQHQAYELAKSVMVLNAATGDAQEGMCAFLEKRRPRWTGQ